MKPSRLLPIAATVLLVAAWTVWMFASDGASERLVVVLWAAALLVAIAPLVLSVIDRARDRTRQR
jgi:hypothetical protein